MTDTAVRYFTPESNALPRTLRGKLEKRRHELTLQLADGSCIDFADYKSRVGVIRGLTEAIGECIEAEKDGDR